MLRGGDQNNWIGMESPEGWCCFAANYFYCLRLPINTMLGGGDQNNRVGMESPVGLMLHCSKLFLPEFVLPVKGTNLDGLNVSCLIKGQIQSN